MASRFRGLLYSGNYFRTNKCVGFYLNSMLYHSSQHVFDLQWYQNEFPRITKLADLLANVDAIDGRLVDINSNSAIFDDGIEHEMCTFKSLVRVFIGSPSVQHKMKHVLASSNTDTQHDSFTPFCKASEREPLVIDSLTKVSNFLSVSAQQRKLVRFRVCPQVTQHRIWTGALEEILNSFKVDLDSLGSQGLNEGTMLLGQQIVHSCLKFLTETALFSDPDSSSWMKLLPSKTVNFSDSQKWEDVLGMFNDLIKCCRSETRLKLHVDKAEVMKEGLLHIKDIFTDNKVGYKEVRHQENLVQKKLSKTLGHSSRCLFTLLMYYLYGRVTDIELDMRGGVYGNGSDNRFSLLMGRILTSDSEKMVGRGVKQLDRALGLFKLVWEMAEMKGHLDLQGHMWCVGAHNRMLRYRGNTYFVHGICL
ncbi:uncharacterized protein LOC133297569 [Gastrolobium bilobum]|uniref:uncharacterized protein LOC133297569 n=1 Tax=Gastrolobium bilobum TaxID=150636 RepID=UPI002AAF77D8|nr:uncharacterized protein LOC133297569 [Gastrolobium bilobum]